MRSFLVSTPSKATANVIVFLHGVGEAFIPLDDAAAKPLYSKSPGDVLAKLGLQNLFHHGVPRLLNKPGDVVAHDPHAGVGTVPFSHPLFVDFVTIAPQTLLREDHADEAKVQRIMDKAVAIARAVTETNTPKIAVVGFSRGGFAALRLGARPEVTAIVTMDAVAKGTAQALGPTVAKHEKPFWAFFSEYPAVDDRKERITDMHRNLDVPEIKDLMSTPNHARCKTAVPTYGPGTSRHNQVCNLVSNLPTVYSWIVSRFQAA